jgi:hypothetical protein
MRIKNLRHLALIGIVVSTLIGCSSDQPKGGAPIQAGDYQGGPSGPTGKGMAPGKSAPGAPGAATTGQ